MPLQPNIVFILSDQHNPRVAGYEGDAWVRTPNLDRLAQSGARLANCYCGSPLCVPSRVAMLSSLLPSRTGVYNNNQSLHSDIPTFVHCLTLAGYDTVLSGRMHFIGPDQRHGYKERLVGDLTAVRLGVRNPSFGPWMPTLGQVREGVLENNQVDKEPSDVVGRGDKTIPNLRQQFQDIQRNVQLGSPGACESIGVMPWIVVQDQLIGRALQVAIRCRLTVRHLDAKVSCGKEAEGLDPGLGLLTGPQKDVAPGQLFVARPFSHREALDQV